MAVNPATGPPVLFSLLTGAIRSPHVIAIPEPGSVAHVKENAVALSL